MLKFDGWQQLALSAIDMWQKPSPKIDGWYATHATRSGSPVSHQPGTLNWKSLLPVLLVIQFLELDPWFIWI